MLLEKVSNSNKSSDKVFRMALLISAIAHGAIMLQNSALSLWSRNIKDDKIEVNYVSRADAASYRRESLKPQTPRKIPASRMASKKTPPPPFTEIKKQEGITASKASEHKSAVFEKPVVIKTDVISIKKKITLPPLPGLDPEKMSNPTYLNYYQIVREKIKRAAYQNYSHTETGEVYVSFIVSQKGDLGAMRVNEERTRSTPRLRDIALKSVRDAAPFPIFPPGLEYPQLTFNVIISFEIE